LSDSLAELGGARFPPAFRSSGLSSSSATLRPVHAGSSNRGVREAVVSPNPCPELSGFVSASAERSMPRREGMFFRWGTAHLAFPSRGGWRIVRPRRLSGRQEEGLPIKAAMIEMGPLKLEYRAATTARRTALKSYDFAQHRCRTEGPGPERNTRFRQARHAAAGLRGAAP